MPHDKRGAAAADAAEKTSKKPKKARVHETAAAAADTDSENSDAACSASDFELAGEEGNPIHIDSVDDTLRACHNGQVPFQWYQVHLQVSHQLLSDLLCPSRSKMRKFRRYLSEHYPACIDGEEILLPLRHPKAPTINPATNHPWAGVVPYEQALTHDYH